LHAVIPKHKRKRQASVEGPALEGIALQEASLSHLEDELRCERALVSDASLANTRASGVIFDTCEFRRSAIDGSVLRRLRLLDSRLEKCNASNAEWDNAHLRRIEFLGCRLTGIALPNANCSDVLVKDCKAEFLRCEGSRWTNVRFENCLLTDADFRRTTLDRAAFIHCDLRNVDFEHAKLSALDLRDSTLDGARIEPGQFPGLTIDQLQALALIRALGATVV
jgi:uncharacterized protein YjbI with pentapeptide repeats